MSNVQTANGYPVVLSAIPPNIRAEMGSNDSFGSDGSSARVAERGNGKLHVDVDADDVSSVTSGDENVERGNWTGKLDFVLSCLSYAVGLGNVWRFPYLCYRNGGDLQNSNRRSCVSGVGYGMTVVSFFIGVYYNMIIAWAIYYMVSSFTKTLPWGSCENEWNTEACSKFSAANCTLFNGTMLKNGTCVTEDDVGSELYRNLSMSAIKPKMPSDEYFHNHVLGISEGLDYLGGVRWQLALCLLGSWCLVALCLWKGIKTSGRAVYFHGYVPLRAFSPSCLLFSSGAEKAATREANLFFHIVVTSSLVWGDAAVQIFFSLSPCWGGLITLASYNKFHNNCYRDALVVALANCLTSFYAGFVIFCIIGFMANQLGVAVEHVADKGAGLAFIAYPEALTRLPISALWSILFFSMILTLGMGSQFTIMQTVVTTITDGFPHLFRKRKWIVVIGSCSVCYLLGLVLCSRAGMYMIQLIDSYAATWSVLIIGWVECVALSWVYGVDNFLENISQMLGKDIYPYWYWKIVWKFVTPVVIMAIMMFTWMDFSPLEYGAYDYPPWADGLGWALSFTSCACIPIVAIYKIYHEHGSLITRIRRLAKPSRTWGPALEKHRREVKHMYKGVIEPGTHRRVLISESEVPLAKNTSRSYDIADEAAHTHRQQQQQHDARSAALASVETSM
ncbi:PREDICTED: sodium- and chloride-dependent glycine transporter 1-like [Priapulus caudatus]|uniref:Sodium- and chloride-dependent glycine transporter 1-like n=1 Tax=Priapulus caudatus TaxID=37621 RepID=A0ABM1FB72_PRICU|nr:PREDICTED: sodium- and chloride-dependent glycine transporter 1-like [Priapulus caudatus]